MSNGSRSGWLVLAAATALAGCAGGDGVARAAAAGTGSAESGEPTRVVNVEAQTIALEAFVDEVTVTGSVTADRDVVVLAEEAGVIRDLPVRKGQRVAAGEPIARIDDRLIRAQYDQARAEAALAQETWARQRKLWEEDSIGSELAYLRAKYGAETAEATARALEARLDRTVVRAPIGGVLDDRVVEVGATVSPGSPVARVIDVDPLKVRAGVPERFAGEVERGGRVKVTLDGNVEVEGVTTFVGTAVDESNRTFPVEVELREAGRRVKPGMVARLSLARGATRNVVLVPRDAVLRGEDGYIVYVVVTREGRTYAESRLVQTGSGAAGRVVIRSGLEPGDQVIVRGQQQVASGDVVRITERHGGGA